MNVACDVHTHTLYSRHAYSTIEECVRAARDAGMELLGSADHFGNMLYDPPRYLDFQFFPNRKMWPREWMGITLLRGVEADIYDLKGNLYGWDTYVSESITGDPRETFTLLEYATGTADYTIASIHGKRWCEDASRTELTNMYIQTMERHPNVLILGHIGRSNLDIEFDPIIEAARDMHRLIEINEHSFHYEYSHNRCLTIAKRCAELGCKISVSSDAHISYDVGRMNSVTTMLDDIDFPEELVSTRTAASFLAAIEEAGLSAPIQGKEPLNY